MVNDINPDEVPTARPAGTALVPLTRFIERRARRRWFRWAPDPVFVTHLLAQAQQVPQTRALRRANPADAQSAYQTGPTPTQRVGGVTQQVI